ncbi:MAG TPA: oligopeptide/dipeptide ABC transporter ATP-binding protein [Geothermobacteraceae bacterium]|nr:oligopeptide/dipeptide ABC transporter ATP-binding protein [Geothermobacteraceae bacterium]
MRQPLLQVENLSKAFTSRSGPLGRQNATLQAVNDLSFTLDQGETLGLVGESGCGKSTTGRLLLRLLEADQGRVLFQGKDVLKLAKEPLRALRREMQMIFQDPVASLNPRHRVGEIIGEPLLIHGLARGVELHREVEQLLEKVGLSKDHFDRYPHQFSGGQRQRIGIARALAVKPKLIICDEPVSALDLSIQAQVVNLLQDLQEEFNLTYLFIAHDLSVVKHVSDRVAVMYLGRIVELATAEELYQSPRHPYTEALLNAIPALNPRGNHSRLILEGEVPSAIDPPSGCPFHPRCPYAEPLCKKQRPELTKQGPDHLAACHFSGRVGRFKTC